MLATTPILEGPRVRLVPNTLDHDAALFDQTPEDTFRYFLSAPAAWNPDAFASHMRAHRENPKSRVFSVIDRASGAVVGSSSYMDIDPKNRCVEIGSTWYAAAARGTAVNPECKLLLLEHAFGILDCVRVTLKTDERNLHSQRAIAKLGAVREGVLRAHRITSSGYVRNTVMFSVIAAEWPAVREQLTARIKAG